MKCQLPLLLYAGATLFSLSACHSNESNTPAANADSGTAAVTAKSDDYGGFADEVSWGHHLVQISGCNDCHTPKVMTSTGPAFDTTMVLAGHPANVPPPSVDRKEIESKGLMVTNDLSVWLGPWGISYAANLSPDDSTGLGTWTAEQFINCIKKGKYSGADAARPLLPPMGPVAEGLAHSGSDAELSAIFAYLHSIKPIHNVVPAPAPPVSAMKH